MIRGKGNYLILFEPYISIFSFVLHVGINHIDLYGHFSIPYISFHLSLEPENWRFTFMISYAFILLHSITNNAGCPQLLVGLVSSYRYDRELVDSGIASSEALKLHEAIKTKQLDHNHVVSILSTRNIFQLRETFECYKQNYGTSIDQVFALVFYMFLFKLFLFLLFFDLEKDYNKTLEFRSGRTLKIVALVIWNLS